MTKNYVLTLLLISVSFICQNVVAKSSVWKVSQGEHYFYIGGTIHVLSKEDHPLPIEYSKAYQDADKIIFETDLEALESAEFQAQFAAAISFDDTQNLASALAPEIYNKLENFMSARQIPISNFVELKPWGTSLILSLLEYQRLGMVSDYGVENYINDKAKTDQKLIGALETPKEQLKSLQSMERINPNTLIDYTLRDLNRLPEIIHMMKTNWRTGDIEAFSENIFIIQMQNKFPEMYKALVNNRNNSWMKLIPSLIDNDNIEFVLVGSLHLNGNEGLLNQLREQGFKIEPL